MDGWIILSRKLLSNTDIWDTDEPFDYRSAWVDLLMLAEWKTHRAMTKHGLDTLRRGYVYKSIETLSGRWKWTKKKVRTFLDQLEAFRMIETVRRPKMGTIIFLCNYKEYQDFSDDSGTNNVPINVPNNVPNNVPYDNKDNKDNNYPPYIPPRGMGARRNQFHNFEERDTNYNTLMEEDE